MPDVLVRDLSARTVKLLKSRAHSNGRSMQAEIRGILERAAQTESLEAAVLSARIRRMLADREHSDSGQLMDENP